MSEPSSSQAQAPPTQPDDTVEHNEIAKAVENLLSKDANEFIFPISVRVHDGSHNDAQVEELRNLRQLVSSREKDKLFNFVASNSITSAEEINCAFPQLDSAGRDDEMAKAIDNLRSEHAKGVLCLLAFEFGSTKYSNAERNVLIDLGEIADRRNEPEIRRFLTGDKLISTNLINLYFNMVINCDTNLQYIDADGLVDTILHYNYYIN